MVKQKIGSRAQVMHGNAKITGGGLRKKDLKYNKRGKIVSKKASKAAKKSNNLVKAGYITKKGHFGVIKRGGSIKIPGPRINRTNSPASPDLLSEMRNNTTPPLRNREINRKTSKFTELPNKNLHEPVTLNYNIYKEMMEPITKRYNNKISDYENIYHFLSKFYGEDNVKNIKKMVEI